MDEYLLDYVRSRVETMYHDSCVVERPSAPLGELVTDEETGEVVVPPPEVVYQGPCLVLPATRSLNRYEAGGENRGQIEYDVRLRYDAPPIIPGDLFRVTAAVHDSGLLGQQMEVTRVETGTFNTERRLVVAQPVRFDRSAIR